MNSLTKFTSSSKSTKFKDILWWKISQVIPKTVPISTRIVKSYAMKWGIHYDFDGKSMETERTAWSEFPNERKPIVEQILASEERKKSKKSGIWESESGIRVGKLTIWVRSFEIEKLQQEFTRSISSTKIGKPVLMMDENLIYVRCNRIKSRTQRRRRWSIEEKEVLHL